MELKSIQKRKLDFDNGRIVARIDEKYHEADEETINRYYNGERKPEAVMIDSDTVISFSVPQEEVTQDNMLMRLKQYHYSLERMIPGFRSYGLFTRDISETKIGALQFSYYMAEKDIYAIYALICQGKHSIGFFGHCPYNQYKEKRPEFVKMIENVTFR